MSLSPPRLIGGTYLLLSLPPPPPPPSRSKLSRPPLSEKRHDTIHSLLIVQTTESVETLAFRNVLVFFFTFSTQIIIKNLHHMKAFSVMSRIPLDFFFNFSVLEKLGSRNSFRASRCFKRTSRENLVFLQKFSF